MKICEGLELDPATFHAQVNGIRHVSAGKLCETSDREGKPLKVKDWVFFKSDVEQSGQISKIKRGSSFQSDWLTLVPQAGEPFEGEYIGDRTETTVSAKDVRLMDKSPPRKWWRLK